MASDDTTSSSPRSRRSIQRILDAAARLFGREGYNAASMNQVARAAGVSKGLLHYHFQSKEHLLIEAQRQTFRQIFRRFDERFKQGDDGIDPALEALDALWDSLREMRGWAPFMVETMSLGNQHAPVRKHLEEFYAESSELLVEGLRKAFPEGSTRLSIPAERLAMCIRTTLHGLVVELAYSRGERDLERIDQAYQDLRTLFSEVATQEVNP